MSQKALPPATQDYEIPSVEECYTREELFDRRDKKDWGMFDGEGSQVCAECGNRMVQHETVAKRDARERVASGAIEVVTQEVQRMHLAPSCHTTCFNNWAKFARDVDSLKASELPNEADLLVCDTRAPWDLQSPLSELDIQPTQSRTNDANKDAKMVFTSLTLQQWTVLDVENHSNLARRTKLEDEQHATRTVTASFGDFVVLPAQAGDPPATASFSSLGSNPAIREARLRLARAVVEIRSGRKTHAQVVTQLGVTLAVQAKERQMKPPVYGLAVYMCEDLTWHIRVMKYDSRYPAPMVTNGTYPLNAKNVEVLLDCLGDLAGKEEREL